MRRSHSSKDCLVAKILCTNSATFHLSMPILCHVVASSQDALSGVSVAESFTILRFSSGISPWKCFGMEIESESVDIASIKLAALRPLEVRPGIMWQWLSTR